MLDVAGTGALVTKEAHQAQARARRTIRLEVNL